MNISRDHLYKYLKSPPELVPNGWGNWVPDNHKVADNARLVSALLLPTQHGGGCGGFPPFRLVVCEDLHSRGYAKRILIVVADYRAHRGMPSTIAIDPTPIMETGKEMFLKLLPTSKLRHLTVVECDYDKHSYPDHPHWQLCLNPVDAM